jgi:hypothetical protein
MRVTITRALRSRILRLPLLALLLMSLSGLPLAACGASVTHKPAAELRLIIYINHSQDEVTGENSDTAPHFYIGYSLLDGATGSSVVLPEGAAITCNGIALWKCSQQPSGGAYQFTFTDEHGAVTTVTVPVPQGGFAILSPHSGGTAVIPTDGLLTIHYATSLFLPGWTIAVDRASAECDIQNHTSICAVETSPQNQASGSANAAWAVPVAPGATPTPPATPTAPAITPTPPTQSATTTPTSACAPVVTPSATPDATSTPTPGSVERAVLLRGDFSRWVPGCGRITLFLRAEGKLEPSGFQSVTVKITDTGIIPVTWVR